MGLLKTFLYRHLGEFYGYTYFPFQTAKMPFDKLSFTWDLCSWFFPWSRKYPFVYVLPEQAKDLQISILCIVYEFIDDQPTCLLKLSNWNKMLLAIFYILSFPQIHGLWPALSQSQQTTPERTGWSQRKTF